MADTLPAGSAGSGQQRTVMNPRALLFDAGNPRLRGETEEELSQDQIFEVLWRDFAVNEVAESIAANGYFEHEPLFVIPSGDQFIVVEGNKALIREHTISGVALPPIDKAARSSLEEVPVIVTTRTALWEYVGFKHVNGPQAWQSLSKAEYIAWVHNTLRISLDEIARRIGDQHSTVQRLYRALMVMEQAEAADVFHRSDRYKGHFSFSHLYTGLDYAGIQEFIGLPAKISESKKPVPAAKLKNLGELCVWLYGSKSQDQRPLIQSQNPDLRVLDEILRTPNGTAALRQRLPLGVSRDIGKGDPQLLREALVAAKDSLQTARGRALTGYDGQTDLIKLADDIVTIADGIVADLKQQQARDREKRRQGRLTP